MHTRLHKCQQRANNSYEIMLRKKGCALKPEMVSEPEWPAKQIHPTHSTTHFWASHNTHPHPTAQNMTRFQVFPKGCLHVWGWDTENKYRRVKWCAPPSPTTGFTWESYLMILRRWWVSQMLPVEGRVIAARRSYWAYHISDIGYPATSHPKPGRIT